MMLASLYNTPHTTPEFQQWLFHNYAEHHLLIQGIKKKYNIQLTEYCINPLLVDNIRQFLIIHQQMHDDMDAVLGISGNDFTDIDFDKPDSVESFLFLHADEHRQANQKLGT